MSSNEYKIENSDCEKLLGGNIPDTWKKARGKLNVFVGLEPFIGFLNFQDR